MLLSQQDIEAELSYAYIHAVASHAGFGCTYTDRHTDNVGVDAVLRAREKLATDSILTDFTVDVQLKATIKNPAENGGNYSYSLRVKHYDKLRITTTAAPRLLVVLFLPQDSADWLSHSENELIAKRCAYWVSLRAAPESPNSDQQTVYLPKNNLVSPNGLRDLLTRFSRREHIDYAT